MESKYINITKESVNFYIKNNKYMYMKRLFDIVISFFLIVILIPLFIIVGILILLDGEKAPIFFQQDRVGRNENIFRMYKFRSMYPNAEKKLEEIKHLNEIDGLMFKIKKDPRVTRVGKFIRSYSIDELPQLINVLKGEMSLIGPRPPLINEYLEYTDFDKKRLSINPGITGLWQVSGRNSLSFDKMVSLDIKYINNLSMKNDLIIFFKTIIVVLKKENAY